MKKLMLILAIMALFAALPSAATAAKKCDNPPCNKPPPEPVAEVCDFGDSGVLAGWNGTDTFRCTWIVPKDLRLTKSFTFRIQAVDNGDQPRVLIPFFAVADVAPYVYGDPCVTPHESGWHDVPYPADGEEDAWTFVLPADGECGDLAVDADEEYEFGLTVAPQKVKPPGHVKLVLTIAQEPSTTG